MTIKFSPSEALVYDSTAVVSYGNGQHDQIQICGIGELNIKIACNYTELTVLKTF